MPTRSQKVAVTLAFVAAVLSLTAAGIRFFRDGAIEATPLFGGLFMLALGIGGFARLKNAAPDLNRKD